MADSKAPAASPWFFRGFGLLIRSDIDLPELDRAAPGLPDLAIAAGSVDRPDPEPPVGRAHEFGPGEQYLGLASIGKFLIQGTDRVVADMSPDLPDNFAGFSLLGPVMAAVMHVRGNLVLHGSALVVQGRAVLFLGDKGAGKSTTAGAMIAAGHALATDDVIAIRSDGHGMPMVTPSYPMVKLSDEALNVFGEHRFRILPLGIAGPFKQRARLRQPTPLAPVPIACIYILARRSPDADPEVLPLPPGDALKLLMANSYMARYGTDAFQEPGAMAAHMRMCADLVRHAPVAELAVPGDIARLAEAVTMVEHHVASTVAAG